MRLKGLTGNHAELSLERAGMTCNKNAVPYDPEKPMVTSGIRLGTPAATTRGFGVEEWREVGHMIVETLDGLAENGPDGNGEVERKMREKAEKLCLRHPIYQHLLG